MQIFDVHVEVIFIVLKYCYWVVVFVYKFLGTSCWSQAAMVTSIRHYVIKYTVPRHNLVLGRKLNIED